MAIHYNAFISYRHSPLDSKIAQRIHRQLEHFKIPRAIQKATNIKKIDRIFRDKEELPLSINLSDDINEALANSDYLIVICSPSTRESLWVQQEIRTFLELHSRERILIVLAEGEPNDVVPPILLEGQEPLCCDFRMKAGQATHMELPRLAAALIGCRYDDLVQRQKQYRNRRLAAVLSGLVIASTAFGLYAFSTSQRIQANLTRALISQSQYLAGESKELLNRGDRMSAILLALEALPSQDKARPWLPEAELALAEAVGVYQSEPQSQNVNIYQHKGQVLDFLEAYGGRQLISWDDTNLIYVWDAETYELITSFTPECSTDSLQGLVLSENRLLLLHSFSYDLYCYNFLEVLLTIRSYKK